MKTILVASQNPVKAQAALGGFQRMFPGEDFALHTLTVASGVADQPFSSAETLQGAIQRAQTARQVDPAPDYWVGIEGGVAMQGEELWAYAWIGVLAKRLTGQGSTRTF